MRRKRKKFFLIFFTGGGRIDRRWSTTFSSICMLGLSSFRPRSSIVSSIVVVRFCHVKRIKACNEKKQNAFSFFNSIFVISNPTQNVLTMEGLDVHMVQKGLFYLWYNSLLCYFTTFLFTDIFIVFFAMLSPLLAASFTNQVVSMGLGPYKK
jgi:hypothetical protein